MMVFALTVLSVYSAHGQYPKRPDLTGKWQLTIQDEKGKQKLFTVDLMESGSLLLGTVTPIDMRALTIRDGYYVGAEIQILASGRKGLFSESIEISGHIAGDKMILSLKQGNGATYPAAAERIQVVPRK